MSQLNVDTIKNRTGTAGPTLPGATFTGNIVGTAATFSGNVSIAGTLTYEDVTNVDSIGIITARSGIDVTAGGINAVGVVTASGVDIIAGGLNVTTGVSTFSGGVSSLNVTGISTLGILSSIDTRIKSIGEKSTIISGTNTLSLVYDTGGGNIAIHTNPSANVTLAITGIPTDSSFDNTTISFSAVLINTGTARSCTAVTLNGYSASIKWFGGSLANATSGVTTSNGTDIYSFTGINTIGSASTTANYLLLGNVNGSYR